MQTLVTFVFKFLAALPFGLVAQIRQPARQFGFPLAVERSPACFENMKLAGLNPTDEAVKKNFP